MTVPSLRELQNVIDGKQRQLSTSEHSVPYNLMRIAQEQVRDSLVQLYEVLNAHCRFIDGSDSADSSDYRKDIFDFVNELSHEWERTTSATTPPDVFFFIECLRDDFSVRLPVAVKSGHSYATRHIEDLIPVDHVVSQVRSGPTKEQGTRRSPSVVVIEAPTLELEDPLAWSLMVHELVHQAPDIRTHASRNWPIPIRSIPTAMREEVLVDVVSALYAGPCYATRLARFPEKIGAHSGLVHPSAEARVKIVRNALGFLAASLKPKSLAHHIYSVAETELKKRERALPSGNDPFKITNRLVETVVRHAQSFMVALGVSTWQDAFQAAESKWLVPNRLQRLETLVRDGGDLPVHSPVVQLNLALAVEARTQDNPIPSSQFESALLSTFKRWTILQKCAGSPLEQ